MSWTWKGKANDVRWSSTSVGDHRQGVGDDGRHEAEPNRPVQIDERLMTDFMAVMPSDDPRFLLLIMLDEPKPIPETKGFATSGWNAAPVTARIIARIAPLLGLEPRLRPAAG